MGNDYGGKYFLWMNDIAIKTKCSTTKVMAVSVTGIFSCSHANQDNLKVLRTQFKMYLDNQLQQPEASFVCGGARYALFKVFKERYFI